MPRLGLTVTEEQAGRTVLSLLRGELGLSSTLVKRLKRTDRGLLLNGAPVHTDARPRAGESAPRARAATRSTPGAAIPRFSLALFILSSGKLPPAAMSR